MVLCEAARFHTAMQRSSTLTTLLKSFEGFHNILKQRERKKGRKKRKK
jgi:hypothetical protein